MSMQLALDVAGCARDSSRSEMKARFILQLIIIIFCLSLFACGGGSDNDVQGEIIGIKAQASMDELQSGDIKNLAYAGNLTVLLPDGETITVAYPKELLSEIEGCPQFNTDQIKGGFVATIDIKLDDHQEVIVFLNQNEEWEVKQVIK
jgi:hypothetical protein